MLCFYLYTTNNDNSIFLHYKIIYKRIFFMDFNYIFYILKRETFN